MHNDKVLKIITVALLLCVVCSVVVSSTSVLLRSRQIQNRQLDIKKNLLLSAGLLDDYSASKEKVDKIFSKIEPYIINLKDGTVATDVDQDSFDQIKSAKDFNTSISIDPNDDFAKIKRRSIFARVFIVKKDGKLDMIILPVYGKGLWSTLYGFIAIDSDIKTVRGFGFYQHGETPGLGGEVDNINWKKSWIGKKVIDDSGEVIIDIVKGSVNPDSKSAISQVDGLSGATITSNGVESLLKYWLGKNGYNPFLKRIAKEDL